MKRHFRLPFAACAATVLLAGLLTGCGDDSKDEPTPEATASKAAESDQATTEPGDDETTATDDATTPAPVDDLGTFCTDAAAFSDGSFLDDVDDTDTEAVQDGLRAAADDARSIDVPEAIADDWDTVVGGIEAMSDALEGLDVNNDADEQVFNDRLAELAQGDLEAAGDRIDDFMAQNCG